ncbi:MAG: SDR family NAD(P)-dependent oxidoreductase [Muribaculaceae bacterium]|nr:SDR family NAD(P)-dependent oxidoreductase [Muribaculaceae bacterium]
MNIIIMGASSGIGAELALFYIERGHRVGCASRSVNKITARAAARAAIDINSPDAGNRLRDLIDELGGMDLYIHVAGIGYDNPGLDPGREADIAATNCVGFARMISTAFNWFESTHRPGHIAAITSVAATKGLRTMEAYSASKRFGATYLQGLRQRAVTGRLPIAVTDLRPGWTRTPLLKPHAGYPMLMTPDRVCRHIAHAIDRRRKTAFIDGRWRLLCALWSIIPDFIWRHIPYPR